MKKIVLLSISLFLVNIVFSQNVGINSDGSLPDGSAMLDIKATNKGILVPRVELFQTNFHFPITNTNPPNSLLVYNTATRGTSPNNVTPGFYYWETDKWVRLGSGSGGSSTSVNTKNGINLSADTVKLGGTLTENTNIPQGNFDLNFDNNTLVLDGSADRVGVGTNAPTAKLDINGNVRIHSVANGAVTDEVLTKDASGYVRKLPISDLGGWLDKVTENSETGYRIRGRNPAYYGNTGTEAIDLSYNNSSSTTMGATGDYSTILGGNKNTASGESSVISGGSENTASGFVSSVSGGLENTAQGSYTMVGSGAYNIAMGNFSTIAGGMYDTIGTIGYYSSIAGGRENYISERNSFIGGGLSNTISSQYSNVLGGQNNTASGNFSTVSGGQNNKAKSFGEWVGGLTATDYTPNSITSWNANDRLFVVGGDGSDAFTILKNGKVGIDIDNFETTTNSAKLQVNGTVKFDASTSTNATDQVLVQGSDGIVYKKPASSFGSSSSLNTKNGINLSADTVKLGGTLTENTNIPQGNFDLNFDNNTLVLDGSADRVGVGTNFPTAKVDINGNVRIRSVANGAVTDEVLTKNISGYVRKLRISDISGWLDRITENSKTGYRIRGRNPAHYGNIGTEAVDLTHNYSNSDSTGATGDYSGILAGNRNMASGEYSGILAGDYNRAKGYQSAIVGGETNIVLGDHAVIVGGQNCSSISDNSFVTGYDNEILPISGYSGGSTSQGSFVAGSHNVVIEDHSTIAGGTYDSIRGDHCFIGGGQGNKVYNSYANIGGGRFNVVKGRYANVSGGQYDTASGYNCFVGGGYANVSSGSYSGVLGGRYNYSTGHYSSVGAGNYNTSSGDYSTVSGGSEDTASGNYSAVGGGYRNMASGGSSSIAGGERNVASGAHSTVSGGYQDTASGRQSTIGGGSYNTASERNSTVSGGAYGVASGEYSTVSGGYQDTASGDDSNVGGGRFNTASGDQSTVSGGEQNVASGGSSSIAGGERNVASGDQSTVSGGERNVASGNQSTVSGGGRNNVSGRYATVSGGYNNKAKSYGEWVGGVSATDYTPNSATSWNANDRLFVVGGNGSDAFTILKNGKVGIGISNFQTTTNSSMLQVNGSIASTSGIGPYPDYVFEKYFDGVSAIKSDYKFKKLDEIETFLKKNKHLPGYKSYKEVQKEGFVNLTNTQMTHMEKIEELFLHTIEQEKKIERQQQILENQQKEIDELKELLKKKIANNY